MIGSAGGWMIVVGALLTLGVLAGLLVAAVAIEVRYRERGDLDRVPPPAHDPDFEKPADPGDE